MKINKFIRKVFKLNIIFWIIAVLLIYGAVFGKFYFTHEYLPTHDYHVAFISGHLVMNYLINAHLPLWSPEQNCGYPVWPDTEIFPGYDPVSLIVNFIFALKSSTSIYSHIVTVFIWHFIFAFGGYLLFRRLRLTKTAAFFGFTVLLFSSLTALNFRQTDDYVTVYRYVPLLFYAFLRFFQDRNFKNSILLGLIGGLSVAGYQTPNIIILLGLLAIAVLVSIKEKVFDKNLVFQLIPAGLITALISAPFILSTLAWITNKAVCRESFPFGYRGGLTDILGPITRLYPDETLIYIGIIPFLFAFFRICEAGKKIITGNWLKDHIQSILFLVFGIFLWIVYIGFPENFIGFDKPFFNIRSYNNMLPYVVLVLAYFASEYVDGLNKGFHGFHKEKQNLFSYITRNPILLVVLLGTAVIIFVEFSRPGILTVAFNRYGHMGRRPEELILLEKNHDYHWSLAHIVSAVSILIALILLLSAGVKKYKTVFFGLLFLIVIIDMSILNRVLLESYYTRWNNPEEIRPVLNQAFPERPPLYRSRDIMMYGTPADHQPNELYHKYSADVPDYAVWFKTKEFYKLSKSIDSKERLDYITGVTRPLVYFVREVILKENDDDILEELNNISEEKLANAIIVKEKDFPKQYPLNLDNQAQGTIEILDYGPNHIKFNVNADNPVYLIYLDSYDKSWKAYLDNKKAPIIRANYNFKAVFMPQGEHKLSFVYRPYLYIISLLCRIIGVLLAVVLMILPVRMGRFFLTKHG